MHNDTPLAWREINLSQIVTCLASLLDTETYSKGKPSSFQTFAYKHQQLSAQTDMTNELESNGETTPYY